MSWIKPQIRKILGHWKRHGVFPNIINPVTFNDKVLYRRLFDRRPALTQVSDKAAVRFYVESRLGPQILPKLYYLTTRPDAIPFDQLPNRFVVKPTHGSGWIQLITDKSALDRAALIETCSAWLKRSYYKETLEWAYKHIEPRIIVEEFIDDGSGTAPNDYKLFVFDGTVKLIQVDTGRFIDHRRRLYTPAWEKLDVLLGEYEDVIGDVPRPVHLAEMIAAAQKLGDGWDFIRAEFYDTGARLCFGELTTYPGAGGVRFRPQEFDRYLGQCWKLYGTE
jgi:TupA-like ATPgrasp